MFSACLRLSTSTSKLPFLVFLTFFGLALVDITFSMRKDEFGSSYLLQRFNNNESGEVCCLILRVWFWEVPFSFFVLFEDAIYAVYFSLVLRSSTHHGVQLVLGINQGVTHSPWLRRGIRNQYTRVEGRLPSRCQFLGAGKIPILYTIDPQPPPSSN